MSKENHNSLIGKWEFEDEILEFTYFIDEDGNIHTPGLPDWSSPPSLTFEFELDDEDKEYLNDTFIKKSVLDLGFLFERMKVTNVRRE